MSDLTSLSIIYTRITRYSNLFQNIYQYKLLVETQDWLIDRVNFKIEADQVLAVRNEEVVSHPNMIRHSISNWLPSLVR